MVDPTFVLVALLGGTLVGYVTQRVRGHEGWRCVLDIAAGTLGGFAGTPLWLSFLTHVLPVFAPTPAEVSAGTAALLSNLYYFSPILGGFLGVGLVALIDRLISRRPRREPRLRIFGHFVQIVGIVYLAVAAVVTAALAALAAAQGQWDMLVSAAPLIDLAAGLALLAAGWAMARHAQSTGA